VGRLHVLIVEDEPSLVRLLTLALEGEGFGVTTTDSALGAASLARRSRPDVILLDLGLPYRSGALLLGDLKADPSTADVPVLVVSAMPHILTGERRRLATAVLQKPVDLRALIEAVRDACAPTASRARQPRSRRAATGPPGAGRPPRVRAP
jgi:DNA-binding response OmpR family regulator